MATPSTVERIRQQPRFHELVARRSRLSWTLLAIVMAAYYALTALVAFWPDLLRQPLTEGAMANVGFVAAVAVIVVGWLLTWLYVHRANTEFDEINNEILREVTK